MNAKRFYRRWQSSLEAKHADIRKLLRKRRALTEPEVHDLRVALRRARLLAALGTKFLGKSTTRTFRTAAHALLIALDRVRDCDVALLWLDTANTSPSLVEKLKQQRNRLWVAARRQFKSHFLGKLALTDGDKAAAKKLARRLEKHLRVTARLCLKTVHRAPEVSIEELHELRRVVRRWRYLRELEVAPRQIRRDRRLKTLIEVQESLGALQNAEVILEQLKPIGRSKELQTLRAQLRASFAHLHREALQQIQRLESLT